MMAGMPLIPATWVPLGQAMPDWYPDQQTSLLIVALLLSVWLWMLVRRREDEAQRPTRPTLLSPDELGRTVFLCLLGQDVGRWRMLFVNGAEATDLLGRETAERYLLERSPQVLDAALARLGEDVQRGSIYQGATVDDDEQLRVTFRMPDASSRALHVGSVARIGHALRLFGPAAAES